MADAGVIAAAILEVLDAGRHCGETCDLKHERHFYPNDEGEEETENRTKFVDEVMYRIRVLQSPTFNLGIKLENYCNRHKGARLPEPTVQFCPDCAAEHQAR
jgi:hypothetical protein